LPDAARPSRARGISPGQSVCARSRRLPHP
jgi:hypothetical protein